MVLVKKSTIFSIVFFSKIGLEIVLNYSVKRKEAFKDDKNVNFFQSKKWVFSKDPWVFPRPLVSVKKCTIFSSVFFSKIGPKIM